MPYLGKIIEMNLDEKIVKSRLFE